MPIILQHLEDHNSFSLFLTANPAILKTEGNWQHLTIATIRKLQPEFTLEENLIFITILKIQKRVLQQWYI